MKRNKTQKGITLVALIITIIVLLILAVVAIRAVQGDGIIAHAKNARDQYEQKTAEENALLSNLTGYITGQLGGSTGGESNVDHTTEDGVPIPKGFYVIGGTKDSGLVISDVPGDDITNGTGNQFVWVPVTTDIVSYGVGTTDYREPDTVTGSGNKYDADPNNLERVLEGEYAKEKTAESFKAQLTAEFNKMATSVNKYHGFYVGRYEMSYEGSAKSVKGATSVQNTTAENNWYGLYAKAKTYAPESSKKSVVSSMIYGSQYNAMMTWMGAAANTTIGDNRNQDRTTGTCETDFINNVYDLYGNSFEWTQEANSTDYRVLRGGFYNGDCSPSFRSDLSPTVTHSYGVYSSRLALYVK